MCVAVAHRGFVQPVDAVPAVHIHGDRARVNGGRTAQGFPDARHGE